MYIYGCVIHICGRSMRGESDLVIKADDKWLKDIHALERRTKSGCMSIVCYNRGRYNINDCDKRCGTILW